jgi:ParB-like chromosome segregation protein Spo0J
MLHAPMPGRLETAALKLGMTEVPVHVARGLTPEQARAYRIADNQTATLATWDEFEKYQRDAFVERITAFVERVGS